MRLATAIASGALGLAALGAPAHADAPVNRPEAIEVDREAAPGGQVELGFDGGAPVGAWALSAGLGFVDRPIDLHTVELKTYPVDHRETLVLGGAIAIGGSVVVDARMPMSHQVGDRYQAFGDSQPLEHWVLGDLGIGARVRVAARGPMAVFLRGNLTLGTGDDHNFAGEARYTAAWLVIARATLPAGVVVAATGGIRLRGAEVQVADRLVGDELDFGLGATYGVPPVAGLWCQPEQLKLAAELVGVVGDDVAGERGPSPVEARIGVIGRPRTEIAIGVRVGAGLNNQIGSPRWRAVLTVAWQAPLAEAAAAVTPTRAEDAVEPEAEGE